MEINTVFVEKTDKNNEKNKIILKNYGIPCRKNQFLYGASILLYI